MALDSLSGTVPIIQFNDSSLVALNIVIACMMFGISLTLKLDDFRAIVRSPKAPLVGLFAQFLLLPALTFAFTMLLDVQAEYALGMILVASCPGGSFSNILCYLSKANVAVSVSMTGVSSLAAMVMTPFNFALYGALNPKTNQLLHSIQIEALDIAYLVAGVLVIPIILGMYVGANYPKFSSATEGAFRKVSMAALLGLVAIAMSNNYQLFIDTIFVFLFLVISHNTIALLLGYGLSSLVKLPKNDKRAVTLEVGVQNSGLALSILFTFFPMAGEMMVIAAGWGVWHLISGVSLSMIWSSSSQELAS